MLTGVVLKRLKNRHLQKKTSSFLCLRPQVFHWAIGIQQVDLIQTVGLVHVNLLLQTDKVRIVLLEKKQGDAVVRHKLDVRWIALTCR